MTSTPDVTVIIISFNDAARLPRAIRSVQRQTLRNLEIVVVDDASTDDTEGIVRSLANEDPRLRYERLETNSGGCSAPRNRGIELARAPWVMFCDSDDEYERHACKNLLFAAERMGADVVCGTAERVDVRTGRTKRWRPDVHEAEIVAEGLAEFPELLYDTISVNKIYRRDLIVDNALRFPEGLLFEDQLFTLEAMASARRVASIPETVYRWYVDTVSEEPSITQRRHEVENVDSRIEINRRIDSFLTKRALPQIQRIKDLKFLRHDLYLYLSSMLEVDDVTAQMLIDRLVPYVASTDLSRAWDLRPALRVAIYHLLVDDLAGIRSAMRFIKWASVVEIPIEVKSGGEFWACDHLHEGPEIHGVSAPEWLDVSDLHITLVPFAQRRYLHRLDAISASNGEVTASGTTIDFDGALAAVDDIELVFLVNGDRPIAAVPARWTRTAGRVWHWEASGRISGRLGRRLTSKDQGTLGLVMNSGAIANFGNCRTTQTDVPRLAIPYRGRTEPLGPDALSLGSYGNGAVGWRAVRVSSTRERLSTLRARWFRIPGTQRLATLAGLIRRDVFLSMIQLLGAVLPARRLVVLETDGGRTVSGNVRAISARLQESSTFRQAWVHRGRPELTPDYAEPVEHMSVRHHWLMSRARFWIDDGTSPLAIRKPRHATAVFVADGMPVHRVGLDDPTVLVSRTSVREVRRRSARTDLMVTASPYASELLRPALRFAGATIEAGIARLDRIGEGDLSLGGADLPVDRALVIYAPAWRRREGDEVDPLIDLDEWSSALGERAYLLLRSPRQQRFAISTRLRFAVRSIREEDELATYLTAADLLISDYSPLIGDGAAIDLPTVLYQPDREEFVNRTRGLYPSTGSAGPIATTMAGLIDEVRSFLDDRDAWELQHSASRRLLAATQCGPADRRAADRAVSAILSDLDRSTP